MVRTKINMIHSRYLDQFDMGENTDCSDTE